MENACLSRAVLAHLNVSPTGWDKFYWPCRMERLLYRGTTIVLDGCHNGNSMEKFLKGLRTSYAGKRILVLFGAGHEKCLLDMTNTVFANADSVMMVQSKHFRAMKEAELLKLVSQEYAPALDPVHRTVGDCDTPHSLGDRLQWAVEHNDPDE